MASFAVFFVRYDHIEDDTEGKEGRFFLFFARSFLKSHLCLMLAMHGFVFAAIYFGLPAGEEDERYFQRCWSS